jgi:hypothetical protein
MFARSNAICASTSRVCDTHHSLFAYNAVARSPANVTPTSNNTDNPNSNHAIRDEIKTITDPVLDLGGVRNCHSVSHVPNAFSQPIILSSFPHRAPHPFIARFPTLQINFAVILINLPP